MIRKKNVLNVRELAKYLSVHPVTIYNYLQRNEIPAFRIGKSWRFNKESIDKWRFDKERKNKPYLHWKRSSPHLTKKSSGI